MLFHSFCWLFSIITSFSLLANPLSEIDDRDDNFAFDSIEMPAEDPAHVELIPEESEFSARKPLTVAIRMEVAEGWHSYWKNPGDAGMPLQINWNLPKGFTVSELQWPTPQRFEFEGLVGYGYDNEVVLLTTITPPASYQKNSESSLIGATVRWLVCSDSMCLPGEEEITLSTPFPSHDRAPSFFSSTRALMPHQFTTLQAQRKKSSQGPSLIEIQLPIPSSSLTKVEFFPETKKLIDDTSPASFAASNENPDSTVIMLKSHPSAKSRELKGVLVLHRHSESEALEISTPLLSENTGNISLADENSTKTHFETIDLNEESFSWEATPSNIILALILAFIGGLLLNLMPCVLPVISLKILSFVKMAGQSRALTLKHGLSFCGGVLASFWVLAGAMLLLQSYGHAIGWGFQLQEPIFVGSLAALLLLFSLSFFGVFEIGTSLTSIAGQAEHGCKGHRRELFGSFCSGVLATAIATPCSGPFLGTAIGFAVTLPSMLALLIFTALGVGMASPYLLFAANPSLLRFLPKPGPWMTTFKEIAGFVMLATVLWLLWVFGAQTSSISLFMVLAALLLLAFAGWIYGRYCMPIHSKKSRTIGSLIALTIAIISFSTIWTASSSEFANIPDMESVATNVEWEAFSPERVKELQEQGRPVLIDFTAKWCLICQANHLVLSSPSVTKKLKELNVVKMKADWTRRDPTITEALKKYGRNAVPLYVLTQYDSKDKPLILPQVLTPDVVIDHLNQL